MDIRRYSAIRATYGTTRTVSLFLSIFCSCLFSIQIYLGCVPIVVYQMSVPPFFDSTQFASNNSLNSLSDELIDNDLDSDFEPTESSTPIKAQPGSKKSNLKNSRMPT